jgi:predicted NAD-dependent protein-ADP-ribosyltransferase YbiA (DUF1768 family)
MPNLEQYTLLSYLPKEYTELLSNVEDKTAKKRRLSNHSRGKMKFGLHENRGSVADTVVYRTLEHLYQSERYRLGGLDEGVTDDRVRELEHVAAVVRSQATPPDAWIVARDPKHDELLSQNFKQRWKTLRIGVMRWALWKKFGDPACFVYRQKMIGEQNAQALEKTGDAYLHGPTDAGRFWGTSIFGDSGQNILGRLLMEVRERLKES